MFGISPGPMRRALRREKAQVAAISGHGESILIVDDEVELCETCGEILESMGYQVFTATNGSQGVENFEKHPDTINLLISDVVMPKMSGPEMVNRIREIKPDMPVIFMTGYDKDMLASEVDLENSIIIPKPIDIDLLSTHIDQLLKCMR